MRARSRRRPGVPRRSELCKSLGADLALDYKVDDVPARLREFAPEGIDVWYETLRDPNLEVNVPLLRKRGRMIIIAGRAARPPLPFGSFYPRDCSILGFAMFNASPDEQRRSADEMAKWVEAGKLKALIGKTFPLNEAAQAHKFLEDCSIRGTSQVVGKVVIEID